jgi:hypothetical protein
MTRKEAYRMFWIVKGHLGADEKTVFDCYDGYFRRMWGNHETVYHLDGFEEAWENKLKKEVDNQP